MSYLSLGKKLLPARKAWRTFTSILGRKLHKLKRSRTIKKASSHLNKTITAILSCWKSIKPLIRRKRQVITWSTNQGRHGHYHKLVNSFAPVCVDELYMEPSSVKAEKCVPGTAINGGSEALGAIMNGKTSMTQQKTLVCNKLEASASSSSGGLRQMLGVDVRAAEFIRKFREDMKLQREESLVEFQEMLARGV